MPHEGTGVMGVGVCMLRASGVMHGLAVGGYLV